MSDSRHQSSRSHYNGKHTNFDIEEEYKRPFRSKSYEDILKEFQEELKPTTHIMEEEEEEEESLVPHVQYLTDDFAGQELEGSLAGGDQAPSRGLVRDYIESGTKACDFCRLLLKSIERARANVRVLRRVVRVHGASPGEGTVAEQRRRMFTDLVRLAQLDNPLSHPGLVSSPATKGVYDAPVIHRLKSLQRRVARRRGFVGFCLEAMGMALPPCGASRRGERRLCWVARLDAAARGAYVLDREFQTVGRILARVNDEVKHSRGVVRAFLRNRPGRYAWSEVVRRLRRQEGWLLEQLQELEEHAYLCLLTINSAMNPLVQELMPIIVSTAKH